MPRDIPIGNGCLLIAFDRNAQLREFYFPYVGEENHVGNGIFRFGIWCDGVFSWTDSNWSVIQEYLDNSLATNVIMLNKSMNIRLAMHDIVDFHENIYLRNFEVENLSRQKENIRLFFCQDFQISGNDIGDTAAYRPDVNAMIHYKGERYFLINCFANNKVGADSFAAGSKKPGFEGTWKDAEDGILSRNPIAQGSVDSVISINLSLEPKKTQRCFYWICAGKNFEEVKILNNIIVKKHPDEIFKRTFNYWKLWVNVRKTNEDILHEKVKHLYKQSLIILRTNINNTGSIISANDSEAIQFNRDTYSYMWPRDAAITAHALDLAGYPELSRNFFSLCGKIIDKEGFFLHKYTPSGLPASSWHPWLRDNKPQLPIQEDETALVLWALWEHFKIYKDVEFIKPLYKPLIKNAANFMMNYRDTKTLLPLPSYDLWEERIGIHSFTCAAIFAGLNAAAGFTEAFGDSDLSKQYSLGADEMKGAIEKFLYNQNSDRFVRTINIKKDGQMEIDYTLDSSLYGLASYGVFESQDSRIEKTMKSVYDKLWCKTEVGGLCRYENDYYYRISDQLPGNPWFITTLWLGQYYIESAKTKEQLNPGLDLINWVVSRALPSGVLPEQVNPYNDQPLSVSPLTWSHAEFIITIHKLLEKYRAFNNPE